MGETLGDIVKDCDQTLNKFDAIFIKKVPGIDVKQLITVKMISDPEEKEMKKIIDYEYDCALLLQPPNNYGEEITSANIRKLVAACKDLDTFVLLEVGAEGGVKAE